MTNPILLKKPRDVMATWDNASTLRIYLVGSANNIRQSKVLSTTSTDNKHGATTADGAHIEMTTYADEVASLTKLGVDRKTCVSSQEMYTQMYMNPAAPPMDELPLNCITRAVVSSAETLGFSPSDKADILRWTESGLLHVVGMWMSPNHAAKPLAFYDSSKITDEAWQEMHDHVAVVNHGYGTQIQYRTSAPTDAHWYYFKDLQANEAMLFGGLDTTWHSAFTPAEPEANEERLSVENRPLCLIVDTSSEASKCEAATFLAKMKAEGVAIHASEHEARMFLDEVIDANKCQ